MASKEFDPLANLKPYQGESFDAPTTSLGTPQTGEQSSLKNILENYGWVLPAVGIPAVGAYGAMKGYDLYQKNFGKESNLPDEEAPPKKSIRDRFIGQPSTPPGPQTSIEKQLGGLDINTLPKDQRELINTLNDAERKRMAKQQTAINAINDASKGKIPLPENTMPTIELASPIKTTSPVAPVISPISTPEVPTVADIGKQTLGVAPVEPPATVEKVASELTGSKINRTSEGNYKVKLPISLIEHGESATPGGKLTWPGSKNLIQDYASRKTDLPAIDVVSPDDPNGKWMVVDGSHRLEAAKLRGQDTIDVIVNKNDQEGINSIKKLFGDIDQTKKKGRPTKEAQAKAMEGLTFRSDLGPGDNWLYNTFGPEGRKAILAQYNEGKPAGSYDNSQEIFKKMQQERFGPTKADIPRDIAKQRGVAPHENAFGKLGKPAKVAGVAGLALTAQQAAQAKDLAQLRRLLGEAVLPLSATPSEVQPGTLGPEQLRAFAEAQKLGSPYRSVQPPR
jgi:hypothetical protein